MSHIRFDGQGAGLGERRGGDTASLNDYTLICTCKTELGPVSGFRPNDAGQRSVYCPKCQHITCVDKEVKIVGYTKAPQALIDRAAKQTVIRLASG